jgi:hypothetical protein
LTICVHGNKAGKSDEKKQLINSEQFHAVEFLQSN